MKTWMVVRRCSVLDKVSHSDTLSQGRVRCIDASFFHIYHATVATLLPSSARDIDNLSYLGQAHRHAVGEFLSLPKCFRRTV